MKGASQVSSVSAERVAALYRAMARIRAFENAAEEASKGGVAAFGASLADARVRGPLHLSTGQEAVAAGVCANLGSADYITSTHRGHGHTLAKGASMERMMCELFGRANGFNGGKGGSMHIAEDAGQVRAALEAGAAGYLPKTLLPKAMASALRAIMDGQVYSPLPAGGAATAALRR